MADYKDVDVAAKTALNHPMGPFELMDVVGIDVVYLDPPGRVRADR
ncbi:3-hydroxyacyl-CoA dehydrogenase family protein [Kocuria rhizophila]|nr:3-hydroxyacyl-CoA dehydrogenase family protein [Kocuria rhizophila]